jgi:ABC-type microcin C transport system permease subunit YejE
MSGIRGVYGFELSALTLSVTVCSAVVGVVPENGGDAEQ